MHEDVIFTAPMTTTFSIPSIGKLRSKLLSFTAIFRRFSLMLNPSLFINRCVEVEQPNYLALIQKEIIKKHVAAYDYPVAIIASDRIKNFLPDEFFLLLKAANLRLSLNLKELDKIKIPDYSIYPIQNSDLKYPFEYLLSLKSKQVKQQLGDFIRGLTPLVTDLFEMCLIKKCNIDIRTRCFVQQKKLKDNKVKVADVYYLDREKLTAEENTMMDSYFKNGYKTTFLSSSNMLPFVSYYCKEEKIKVLGTKAAVF